MPLLPVADFTSPAAVRHYVDEELASCLPWGWAAQARSDALAWLLFSYGSFDPREALAELRSGRGTYYALQFSEDLQRIIVSHGNREGSPLPPSAERLIEQALTYTVVDLSSGLTLAAILDYILARYQPNTALVPFT